MKRIVLLAAAIVLTAGSCESDSVDTGLPAGDSAELQDLLDEVTESESGAEDSGGDDSTTSAVSSDFQTIWPIPPFGSASPQPGFGEYTLIDDEFQRSESVVFQMTGTDRDAVVEFYQTTLTGLGYEVGAPLELGGSLALNVSMSENPLLTAVVQVGPASPTDPTIIVNQNKSEFKEQSSGSDDQPDTEAVESEDDASS